MQHAAWFLHNERNERCTEDLTVSFVCIISCEGPRKTVECYLPAPPTGSLISRRWIMRPADDQLQYILPIRDYR